MERLKGRWDSDAQDRPCLVLYKNRDKISEREVYEYCENHHIRGKFLVHLVRIPDYDREVPMDLYDPGEEWILYEPEEIIDLIQRLTDGLI